MIGYETNGIMCTVLERIKEMMKRVNQLRNGLMENEGMLVDIKNIFLFIKNNNSYDYVESDIRTMKITTDDIVKKINCTSEEGEIIIKLFAKNGDNITICDLYRLITGDDYTEKFNAMCEYSFTKMKYKYYDSDIGSEVEYYIMKILEEILSMIKDIRFYIETMIKRKDFNVNSMYDALSDKDHYAITVKSIIIFHRKVLKEITKEESMILLSFLDMNNDHSVDFNDFKRLIDTFSPINSKTFNLVHSDSIIPIEKIEEVFIAYIKDLLRYEGEINNEKEMFIQTHSEFSLQKLFNFLLLSKYNTNISYKDLFISLSKIDLHLTDKDMSLLAQRIDHFFLTNTTYQKLFSLLMPLSSIKHINDFNESFPESSLLPSTLTSLSILISSMIYKEKTLNNIKHSHSKYFTSENITLLFNTINPNTFPYMTYTDFTRYIRRKGISASSIAIELVYKRLNKAHNNKLSVYDLSNELTSI